jgi:hypothetical protein
MQGKLTNRYYRKVRCHIYSQGGAGYYVIEPNHWIWSGQWSPHMKYMVVYDYHTWELYGCRIISPHHNWWYDVVPEAPQNPNPPVDPGSDQFPGGGGGGGEAPPEGGDQQPNP